MSYPLEQSVGLTGLVWNDRVPLAIQKAVKIVWAWEEIRL